MPIIAGASYCYRCFEPFDSLVGVHYDAVMRLFISHAQQDSNLARRLGNELSRAGMEVWSPAADVYPGDNWAKKLGEAMEQSDAMIALVSRDALASGTLIRDIQFALTSRNYGGRVVPVLIGFKTFQAGKDVPWILLRLDPLYLESDDADVRDVVERVKTLAEPEAHVAR